MEQATRPPLWVRLNHPDRRAEVEQELGENGLSLVADSGGFRVEGEKVIYPLKCFQEGHLEIQDLASQVAGNQVESKPGDFVWDCCAGGGGKTLQVAARMDNRGAVFASDLREYKLDELRRRARRADFHNIRTLVWNGRQPLPLPVELRGRDGFDWVLVDAPCSGSGTWRRNPDARFRQGPDGLRDLVALQGMILSNAARAVRPGGRLVYVTCSWMEDEDEGVVASFQGQNPGFSLVRQELVGGPDLDADTLFYAVLVRGAPVANP
jgi:16S rRNA (cytosine967-C5)-methyltransferase